MRVLRDAIFEDIRKMGLVWMVWKKMIYDIFDYEFLRLTGFCRYMPTGLCRRYDTPLFSRRVIYNLLHQRMIKMMSDKRSYKLTKRGKICLAEMGDEFEEEIKTDVKKKSYLRKLRNAQWNVLLTLAGIDIYCDDAKKTCRKRLQIFE